MLAGSTAGLTARAAADVFAGAAFDSMDCIFAAMYVAKPSFNQRSSNHFIVT